MPIADPDGLIAGLNNIYQAIFTELTKPSSELIALLATEMKIPTGKLTLYDYEEFAFLEEWLGSRTYKSLKAETQEIVSQVWTDGVTVPWDAILRGNVSQFTRRIQAMALSGDKMAMKELAKIYQGTSAATGMDGKKLAASDHPMGTGTHNNSSVLELNLTNFKTGFDTFGALVNDVDQEIEIAPTHIMTKNSGAAFWKAKELLENRNIHSGTSTFNNPAFDSVVHITNRYITSSTYWGLLVLDEAIKPALWLPERPLVMEMDEKDRISLRKISWVADMASTTSVGAWQTAWISTGAGA